jgi:hypothetical protein
MENTVPLCVQCNQPTKRPSTRFCSIRCRSLGTMRPLAERFWEKVNRDGPAPAHRPELGACWVWLSTKNNHGYGQISLGGRRDGKIDVHRLSYRWHCGPITDGLWVLHHCDTPSCVRPDHLFLGDRPTNIADQVAKGRQTRGERSNFAKLTADQVREIRARYAATPMPYGRMAADYGVTETAVRFVVTRRNWAHLP